MKRLLSIPLLALILFSGININIASHYCGGQLAGTKVSLTGERATCGMEEPSETHPPNGSITKHCCDNVILSVSMASNYVPSANMYVPDKGPELSHFYIAPGSVSGDNGRHFSYLSPIIRPPGSFVPNDVEQQSICLFRI
jgi:hypothetical protein